MPDNRIEELKRRVQLDPASIAFAALAEEYRRAGQFEDAIAICQTGLLRHPAYLSARVTLGRALLETGRFEEARHELQLVLRSAPENLAAIRALAEIHDHGGEYDEASGNQPATPPVAAVPAAPPSPAPRIAAPVIAAPPPPVAPIPAPRVAPPAIAAPPPAVPPIPAARVAAPAIAAPPIAAPAAAAVRVPGPDEAALPSLEAFLAAICAAKSSGRPPGE
jgi:hypothetical protein